MAQIYISYQTADQEFALEVSNRLKTLGHKIAIDKQAIAPGQEWRAVLSDALFRSDCVVFLLSPKALESKFVISEIGEARGLLRSKSIQLLPVILDVTEIPHLISDLYAIIAPDRDVDRLVSEIDQAIKRFPRDAAKGNFQSSEFPQTPRLSETHEAEASSAGPASLFSRLSPSSRTALSHADSMRRQQHLDRVHMEHLIVGLSVKEDGPAQRLLANHQISGDQLFEAFDNVVYLPVPRPGTYQLQETVAIPPLSQHVEQALALADTLATEHQAARIQSRHLLAGALGVDKCEVIAAFRGLFPAGPNIVDEVLGTSRPSISPCSLSDQPCSTDALGFKHVIYAAAEFLCNAETKPPLTMSIEGEWGSGKSSFMKLLQKELEDRGKQTVEFNAWRHDKEEALWAAFALTFARKLAQKMTFWDRTVAHIRLVVLRFRWKDGWFDLTRAIGLALVLITLTVALITFARSNGAAVIAESISEKSEKKAAAKKSEATAPEAAKKPEPPAAETPKTPKTPKTPTTEFITLLITIGGFGGYGAIAIVALKKLTELLGNPLELHLNKYVQHPDYEGHIAFVESFHEDFRKIVETYAGKQTVYVFIDDLDRCEIPKSADLMQGINLLVSDDPRLIFIIGMDRQKVAAGLAAKYQVVLPYLAPDEMTAAADGKTSGITGILYGYSFIEKFIQIPLQVPQPTEPDLREFLLTLTSSKKKKPKPEPTPDQAPTGSATTTARPPLLGPRSPASEPAHVTPITPNTLGLTGDSAVIQSVCIMVAPSLNRNPRRLKQFINVFRLRAYIADAAGYLGAEPAFTMEQLGKFALISLRWPDLLSESATDHGQLFRLEKYVSDRVTKDDLRGRDLWWVSQRDLVALLNFGTTKGSGQDSKLSFETADIAALLRVCR